MRHFHLLATMVVALSVQMPAPMVASADDAAEARFHDQRARRFYAERRFEDAIREFILEQQISRNPRIAFNIALCHRQLGNREEAFHFFSEYLGSEDADPERRSTAHAAVAELEPRLARVRVVTEPAGGVVFVDSPDVGAWGRTPRILALAPGEHTIEVRLDGHRPAEASVVARTGELVEVLLRPQPILGRLEVQASPGGIAIVRGADGTSASEGPTPLSAELRPGDYQVEVASQGHRVWRSVVRVEPDEVTTERAALQPLPPPSGDVTVTSNFSGAVVELDGEPVGFAPMVLPDVPAGSHSLSVAHPGALPWSGEVDVDEDERAFVTVTLEEPARTTRSPYTWILGGAGLASLAAAAIVGGLALRSHRLYRDERDTAGGGGQLRDRGERLSVGADVLAALGGVGLAVGVTLYFATAPEAQRASRATVARSAP